MTQKRSSGETRKPHIPKTNKNRGMKINAAPVQSQIDRGKRRSSDVKKETELSHEL